MPAYSDWSARDKNALVDDVANAVVERILDADMNAHEKGDDEFRGVSLRAAIKRIARKVDAVTPGSPTPPS